MWFVGSLLIGKASLLLRRIISSYGTFDLSHKYRLPRRKVSILASDSGWRLHRNRLKGVSAAHCKTFFHCWVCSFYCLDTKIAQTSNHPFYSFFFVRALGTLSTTLCLNSRNLGAKIKILFFFWNFRAMHSTFWRLQQRHAVSMQGQNHSPNAQYWITWFLCSFHKCFQIVRSDAFWRSWYFFGFM